ncbi:hypothetical protein CRENBAI_017045 [Crenichthys baileyi]|uniref:Uncharacterized protein n=1 Tax=Crenichthys baileyi TaxID=28760 RepID=A0AAV9SQB4_9TELE
MAATEDTPTWGGWCLIPVAIGERQGTPRTGNPSDQNPIKNLLGVVKKKTSSILPKNAQRLKVAIKATSAPKSDCLNATPH